MTAMQFIVDRSSRFSFTARTDLPEDTEPQTPLITLPTHRLSTALVVTSKQRLARNAYFAPPWMGMFCG